ncbi:SDR family oxidoreductase [Dechloromonas sp. XY25]|uniref:SDR family oxidoreductase n=1 Tax=Dechloromonas hankyongensis TaxID=2908002 RepID=A0ABS9JZY2_9RHOO|nr:SDR family oxidoreductase [Dechloromonas hankyongensis]MCG2576426.1 SDR family oxidoreductase [Dechloromonas hankyongensis]
MTVQLLNGKRVLITHADAFMGPALCETFRRHGAHVVADGAPLLNPDEPAQIVAAAGQIDVLVVNLAMAAPSTPLTAIDDDEWQRVFRSLVDPLPRLVKAVLPQMQERRRGKILVMGSAAALRGIRLCATYSAARGAQLAFVQAAGVELAPSNIQINAIAQNFVDNPTYFPPEVQANPKFQERLKREVPLGRLVSAAEDTEFAAYLCSEHADCFVGQAFPVCGGWAPR